MTRLCEAAGMTLDLVGHNMSNCSEPGDFVAPCGPPPEPPPHPNPVARHKTAISNPARIVFFILNLPLIYQRDCYFQQGAGPFR